MARRPWIVTPHSPIRELTENLWLVDSAVPKTPMSRRMAIVKLSSGKLLFFHAVPLDEPTLARVRAWGEPAYLLIAHANHGVDADAFQKKLGVKLFGPKKQQAKLQKKFDLDGTFDELPKDSAYELVPVGGSKTGEPALIVHSQAGATAVFSDAYMNLHDGAWLLKLAGFVGPDKCPPVFRLLFIDDKAALRAFFERLAAVPRLQHLVPCHGEVRSEAAGETLSRIATSL
jgi:hypothetical protein